MTDGETVLIYVLNCLYSDETVSGMHWCGIRTELGVFGLDVTPFIVTLKTTGEICSGGFGFVGWGHPPLMLGEQGKSD